jgi:hypothetical protein
MTSPPISLVLEKLHGVKQSGGQYIACCPAHTDLHQSLSIGQGDDGRALLQCHAGCATEDVVRELGLQLSNLFISQGKPGRKGKMNKDTSIPIPSDNTATVQHPTGDISGCTLAQYSEAKQIPVAYLRQLGMRDMKYLDQPAIRIPHFNLDGSESGICYRTALKKSPEADNRIKWKSGMKRVLYGLDRLDKARAAGYITLVEGQSDCHTLWYHGEPALGLPGAHSWQGSWDDYLDNIPLIYVVIEPDTGGETVRKWLATSRLRDRVRLIELNDAKDPSGLYLRDTEGFSEAWKAALAGAVPWADMEQAETEDKARVAWALCQDLAERADILSHFSETLANRGVAGESRTAKLIYLGVTSRLLKRPVSIAVKGPSSAGKSFIVERVLDFFPDSAYYALSAMSERALAYSDEPLQHRILVLYEAAGMGGDLATYLMRSLLSEGKVRYETLERTKEGPIKSRVMEREGPTGLLVTTTAASLHPENETRLLSLTVTDSQEQTRLVLSALADESADGDDVKLTEWHALQDWLAGAQHRVTIPYAKALSGLIPPVATRLRRDGGMVLNLIRAHAILHQATRTRDAEDRIVATLTDYSTVRDLIAAFVSEGVGATVSQTIRETVKAVADVCTSTGAATVSISQVAIQLKLDKSAVSRRVSVCLDHGYLRNLETGKGKPYKLEPGDPLPEDQEILPTPDKLAECCTVAVLQGGIHEGVHTTEAIASIEGVSNGQGNGHAAFDPSEATEVTHEGVLSAGVYHSTPQGTYLKRG